MMWESFLRIWIVGCGTILPRKSGMLLTSSFERFFQEAVNIFPSSRETLFPRVVERLLLKLANGSPKKQKASLPRSREGFLLEVVKRFFPEAVELLSRDAVENISIED